MNYLKDETNEIGNTNKNSNQLMNQVDFFQISIVLLHRWWQILLAGCITGVIAFCMVYFLVQPTYESKFTAYVNNASQSVDSLTNADIQASRSLTTTYAEIISSQPVMDLTVEKSGVDINPLTLNQHVTIGSQNQTEILKIVVTTHNPDDSYKLALALQETAPDYVGEILIGSSMKIVQPASYPNGKSGPNYRKYTVVGFCAGAMLISLVISLFTLLDTRIKSVDMIQEHFNVVVIGNIHDLTNVKSGGYGYYEKKKVEN